MATEVLTIEMQAKVGQLQRDLDSVNKRLGKTDAETSKVDKAMGLMSATAGKAAKTVKTTAVAMTALAAAVTAATKALSANAAQIQLTAQLMNDSVENVQAFGFAFGTVGIEMEKMADISKDTLEKVGDYLNTGGGGFQDFVDVMGLTQDQAKSLAKEFSTLSGAEVLQRMTTMMDEAEVSTVQMSHALEGMASDTTALIPLLKNSGEELNKLTDDYHKYNNALSETDIQTLVDLENNFSSLGASISSTLSHIAVEYADMFDEMINDTKESLKLISDEFASGAFTKRLNAFYDAFVDSWAAAYGDAELISKDSIDYISGLYTELAGTLLDFTLTLPIQWKQMTGSMGELWFDVIDEIQIKLAEMNVVLHEGLDLIGQGNLSGAKATLDAIQAQTDARDLEHEKEMERLEIEKQAILDKFYAEQEGATALREGYAESHEERLAQIEAEAEAKSEANGGMTPEESAQSEIDNLNALSDAYGDYADARVEAENITTKNKKKADSEKEASDKAYLGAAQSIGNALFEDNKLVKAGLVVADTAAGIMKAFAELPYPAAIAASAGIAATGAASLASVNGASKGGGSISAPSTPALPTTEQPETIDISNADVSGSNQVIIKFEGNGDDVTEAIAKNMKVMQVSGVLDA